MNSNWMNDLNVRQETIKTLEEKTGNNIFDLSVVSFKVSGKFELFTNWNNFMVLWNRKYLMKPNPQIYKILGINY